MFDTAPSLKTLKTMGPQHAYGIAHRIELTSSHLLSLITERCIPAAEAGARVFNRVGVGHSENNRRAKFYRLTRG